MDAKLPPIHPCEVLLEDFLLPPGVSQYRQARPWRPRPLSAQFMPSPQQRYTG